MTIRPDAVVPRLLSACPSALPAWQEHLAWWLPEVPGPFNDSVLAHHVVESYAAGRTSELPAFFSAIEHLLVGRTVSHLYSAKNYPIRTDRLFFVGRRDQES